MAAGLPPHSHTSPGRWGLCSQPRPQNQDLASHSPCPQAPQGVLGFEPSRGRLTGLTLHFLLKFKVSPAPGTAITSLDCSRIPLKPIPKAPSCYQEMAQEGLLLNTERLRCNQSLELKEVLPLDWGIVLQGPRCPPTCRAVSSVSGTPTPWGGGRCFLLCAGIGLSSFSCGLEGQTRSRIFHYGCNFGL